jgi:GNAT superfamily N-acetyltransferase
MFDRTVRQTGVQISLVAEMDDRVVGFAIGSLFYGEYGILEPTASIDAISVARDARRQRVGDALMRQLRTNLSALGVTTLRTEVSWSDFDLLAFFKREGFAPAARLCLEQRLSD